jgi:hypothetical protein
MGSLVPHFISRWGSAGVASEFLADSQGSDNRSGEGRWTAAGARLAPASCGQMNAQWTQQMAAVANPDGERRSRVDV